MGSKGVSFKSGSEALDRMHYMYLRTDGSMQFPNSFEGDVLKIAYNEIIMCRKNIYNTDCL